MKKGKGRQISSRSDQVGTVGAGVSRHVSDQHKLLGWRRSVTIRLCPADSHSECAAQCSAAIDASLGPALLWCDGSQPCFCFEGAVL